MDRLDGLKQRYASVLETITRRWVRLNHLYVQDNRLFLGAAAPTEEIRNDIWNAIKAINPVLDDIVAEIAVDSSLPAPPAAQRYAVQPGDTLSEISIGFLRGCFPVYEESRTPRTLRDQVGGPLQQDGSGQRQSSGNGEEHSDKAA